MISIIVLKGNLLIDVIINYQLHNSLKIDSNIL